MFVGHSSEKVPFSMVIEKLSLAPVNSQNERRQKKTGRMKARGNMHGKKQSDQKVKKDKSQLIT